MPADSTDEELLEKRAELELTGRRDTPSAARGTLQAAATRYIKLVKHLASWKDRRRHLRAWCVLCGDVYLHRLTDADVITAREKWLKAGLSPKTINHHVDTLRNLYHRLEGRRAKTPCDDVKPLHVPKTPIRRVPEALIVAIDQQLQRRERDPQKQFDGAKTRARFRVFVSTGKRPVEIMRAQPGDVDLQARVWVPRDAKGGFCPGVYLNDDMIAAWKLFIEADAWGKFNHGNFGRVLRKAGWPEDVRPYQARHSTWITASERGVPLNVVADGAGHTDMRLTKRFYTGILNGPLQHMSEVLDGRFQGWPEPQEVPHDDSRSSKNRPEMSGAKRGSGTRQKAKTATMSRKNR